VILFFIYFFIIIIFVYLFFYPNSPTSNGILRVHAGLTEGQQDRIIEEYLAKRGDSNPCVRCVSVGTQSGASTTDNFTQTTGEKKNVPVQIVRPILAKERAKVERR